MYQGYKKVKTKEDWEEELKNYQDKLDKFNNPEYVKEYIDNIKKYYQEQIKICKERIKSNI